MEVTTGNAMVHIVAVVVADTPRRQEQPDDTQQETRSCRLITMKSVNGSSILPRNRIPFKRQRRQLFQPFQVLLLLRRLLLQQLLLLILLLLVTHHSLGPSNHNNYHVHSLVVGWKTPRSRMIGYSDDAYHHSCLQLIQRRQNRRREVATIVPKQQIHSQKKRYCNPQELYQTSIHTDADTDITMTVNSNDNYNENSIINSSSMYDPNMKQPRTRPLLQSFRLFGSFVMQRMQKNRHRKRLLAYITTRNKNRYQNTTATTAAAAAAASREPPFLSPPVPESSTTPPSSTKTTTITAMTNKKQGLGVWLHSIRQQIRQLNQQRKNVVTLANYGYSIVAPSFISLTIGAFFISIIPHYYAECIQCVATTIPTTAATKATMKISTKLLSAMIGLLCSMTAAAFFTGLRGSLFWIGGSRANYNIRVKLHHNLLLQEAAFFDINETGTLLSRLNSDVNKIGQVISYHVNVVFRQLAQCIFGSIYLIRISPSLSVYTFMGISLVAVIAAIYGKFNRELAQQLQDTFANATAVAETSFSMSETIRSFDGVQIESKKYETAQSTALDLEEIQAWGYGTHKFVSDTFQGILEVLFVLACYYYGRVGYLSPGQLTSYMFYANFILESSNEVGDQWAKIQGAVGASTSVFDLIRRIPAVRDPPPNTVQQQQLLSPSTVIVSTTDAQQLFSNTSSSLQLTEDIPLNGALAVPLEVNGNSVPVSVSTKRDPIIGMSNMTIQYGEMMLSALNNVSLDIYEGDRVAIVGRSGSGKSSMLRAILRFYDPVDGVISLDGIPLQQLTRQQIAKKITMVEQEPSLFPMTMLENVLYGIPEDTVDPTTGNECYSSEYEDMVMKALDEAGLPIYEGNDLNLDLYTRVGNGGRSLSGGQRQRVAIARALVRNPEVLLLDEPTAALDTESERIVIQALLRAMKYANCLIMVTHRLSVVSALGVNRVIVMDKGAIIEEGNPGVLITKSGGHYARLAREQGLLEYTPK